MATSLTAAFPFTSELTYDETGWPQLDRAVDSTVLRTMLKSYFTNGLFLTSDASAFKVYAPSDGTSTVLVSIGAGMIQGATGYTEAETTLDLPAADASLPRYDTVVLRLNDNIDYRNLYLDIISGTPASSPSAPELTQSDSIWELGLADIYRAANSTVVTDSNITDTRADSDRCGQVNAIDEIDTSVFWAELNAYYLEFKASCESDAQDIIDTLNNYETSVETLFDTWFEEMKGQLSEDAAGNLQLEIDDLSQEVFNRYYGLVASSTEFLTDGSILTTNDEATITTVFASTDVGGKIITETIVPTEGVYNYIKTTTITPATSTTNKTITEAYTSELKEVS